jgi:Ala-tRNA(Pro) deacylase
MPGVHTKNLFLRNKKGDKHFLVAVGYEKKVNLKALADVLGEKLSFASPERLKERLELEPGSVTLLGVINDPDHQVTAIIDEPLSKSEALCCHPLVNTATLVIPWQGMIRFFQATGHQYIVSDVPSG